MPHPTRVKLSAACLILTLFLGSFIVPSALLSRVAKAQRPKIESQAVATDQSSAQPTEALIAAPYWSTTDGFVSTIEMKNYRVDVPLTVTPVLYPQHGREIALDPITLKPSETRLLNINKALAKRGQHEMLGAAEIRHAPEGAFGANLTVLNEAKSLIYNFQFHAPDMTTRLEGLWWFYDEHTDGFVAAENASAADITVTPTLYARERPYQLDPVRLRPHEMTVFRLRQEQLRRLGLENVTEGGISLESSMTGAVVAGGGLVNPEIGFSAPLRMDDPEMLAMNVKRLGQTLHAIGVTIGTDVTDMSMGLPPGSRMNPIMNLRNVSNEAITVRPVFKYDVNGALQSFALPEVRLNAQQTGRVELLPYWESGQIFEQAHWGSLEIGYTGRPGALIAAVTSVDQTGTYVFDAKIDNRLAAGFHGEYWSVEGDNDTAITIKNITSKEATCRLSLQYDGGRKTYEMQPLTLEPGEARMLMLREVQHKRIPGTDGQPLPLSVTFGGMKLTEEPPFRHFLIDAVVYNPKTATCGSCGYGCVYPRSIFFPAFASGYNVAVGETGDALHVSARMCDGTTQTGMECSCNFASDNTAIATVGSECQASGTGMDVGSTFFRGTAPDMPGPFCNERTLTTSCNVFVRPRINSLAPARGLIGNTTHVIIQGQGFQFAPTVNAGDGISVTINFGNSSNFQLDADFAIAANASGGNHAVTVTVNGQTSTSVNFYVQIPTSASVLSVTTIATGATGNNICMPGTDNGIVVAIKYQVNDQAGVAIMSSSMEPAEFISNSKLNGQPFPSYDSTQFEDIGPNAYPGTSQFTDANGQFLDAPVGFCANQSGFMFSFTQRIAIPINNSLYTVRSNDISVTPGTVGHGSITNNSDISANR